MAVILVIAYTPALINAVKNPGQGAPRFTPDNPTPVPSEAVSKNVSHSTTALVKK